MTISKPLRFVLQISALVTLVTSGAHFHEGMDAAAPWLIATVVLLAMSRQPIAKD